MYVVFDVGGTQTRLGYSANGRSLVRVETRPTDASEAGLGAFAAELAKWVSQYQPEAVAGGLPGQVDAEGALRAATHLGGWEGQPVGLCLEQAVGMSIGLENDAALAGLAEARLGAGRGKRIMAYITISTGVNGVLVVDGKIEPTATGFEVGRELVPGPDGVTISWEELVSGAAVRQRYGRAPREIKDPVVWAHVARDVALGLYNLVMVWSPEVIVLGGPMMHDIPVVEVRAALEVMLGTYTAWPELRLAALGDERGLLGALEWLRLRQP